MGGELVFAQQLQDGGGLSDFVVVVELPSEADLLGLVLAGTVAGELLKGQLEMGEPLDDGLPVPLDAGAPIPCALPVATRLRLAMAGASVSARASTFSALLPQAAMLAKVGLCSRVATLSSSSPPLRLSSATWASTTAMRASSRSVSPWLAQAVSNSAARMATVSGLGIVVGPFGE